MEILYTFPAPRLCRENSATSPSPGPALFTSPARPPLGYFLLHRPLTTPTPTPTCQPSQPPSHKLLQVQPLFLAFTAAGAKQMSSSGVWGRREGGVGSLGGMQPTPSMGSHLPHSPHPRVMPATPPAVMLAPPTASAVPRPPHLWVRVPPTHSCTCPPPFMGHTSLSSPDAPPTPLLPPQS